MCAMTNMVTPKVERDAEARNYGRFQIHPLESGFGMTLGNSLRRVLLSSLEGAAITSIRITDVPHEFTHIPGVREDVIQVMLQIKQIRLIMHEGDVAHMHLSVKGEGVITAADIQTPSELEIVNPDLYLFTMDDNKGRLEIDFVVERGRGYSPSADRSGKLPLGDLPVDAIYTPIKRVNYSISNDRVGHSTDFDKLTLEIWTDGTIAPEKALDKANKILIDHYRYISGISEEILAASIEKEVVGTSSHITSEAAETPIESLDLTVRVFNSLKRTGIATVGDVFELLEKGEDAVMSIRNFGEKSLDELREKMIEKKYLNKEEKDLES